ncbi:MAG: 5'-methylthioadenosine/S-adenosylhomocysteine nucleosidase [Spirochaetes bacterium]|nr:5'-methylthioadenosine/S-adenosylhomocysteine nucleosidase [Spirochaetota bacterium]
MRRLGIIIAVDHEAEIVLSDPYFEWKATEPRFYESGDGRVELVMAGIGKVFASWAAARLSAICDVICTMGTSGGLSDQRIGEIFLCTEFVEHDMGGRELGVGDGVTPFSGMTDFVISNCSPETADFAESACARAGIPVTRGRAMSGDHFLTDPAVAEEKREEFSAQVVDMESAAAAKVCAFRTESEFFALRWVSDNANHDSRTTWEENVRLSSFDFARILRELHSAITK